jgi:hypothetical protein
MPGNDPSAIVLVVVLVLVLLLENSWYPAVIPTEQKIAGGSRPPLAAEAYQIEHEMTELVRQVFLVKLLTSFRQGW